MSKNSQAVSNEKYGRVMIPLFKPYKIISGGIVADPLIVGSVAGNPEYRDPLEINFDEFINECLNIKLPLRQGGGYLLSDPVANKEAINNEEAINFCNKYGLFKYKLGSAPWMTQTKWEEEHHWTAIREKELAGIKPSIRVIKEEYKLDRLAQYYSCSPLALFPALWFLVGCRYYWQFRKDIHSGLGKVEKKILEDKELTQKLYRDGYAFRYGIFAQTALDLFKEDKELLQKLLRDRWFFSHGVFAQTLWDFFMVIQQIQDLAVRMKDYAFQQKLMDIRKTKPGDCKTLDEMKEKLQTIQKIKELSQLDAIIRLADRLKEKEICKKLDCIKGQTDDRKKLEEIRKLEELLNPDLSSSLNQIVYRLDNFTEKEYMDIRYVIEKDKVKQKIFTSSLLSALSIYVYGVLLEGKDFIECEYCGKLFKRTHKKKRFCPHPLGGNKRSLCENNDRKRRQRERQKIIKS